MLYAYILIEQKSEILLISTEYFTESLCGYQQFQINNKFDKSIRKWENPLEVEEKFQNFHNCELILEYNPSKPFAFVRDGRVFGTEIDVVREVGKISNFRPIFRPTAFYPPNSKLIKPQTVLVTLAVHAVHRYSLFHVTSTYGHQVLRFLVPTGEKLTSYEKILLPFDKQIWMYLHITFAVSFTLAFFVRYLPPFYSNFLYGSRIQHPEHNIVSMFFGISIFRLPRENPARIMLIFFIMFCLVIRTGSFVQFDKHLFS